MVGVAGRREEHRACRRRCDDRLRVYEGTAGSALAHSGAISRHPQQSTGGGLGRGDEAVARNAVRDAVVDRDAGAGSERGPVPLVIGRVERVQTREPREPAARLDTRQVVAALTDCGGDENVAGRSRRCGEGESVGRVASVVRSADPPAQLAAPRVDREDTVGAVLDVPRPRRAGLSRVVDDEDQRALPGRRCPQRQRLGSEVDVVLAAVRRRRQDRGAVVRCGELSGGGHGRNPASPAAPDVDRDDRVALTQEEQLTVADELQRRVAAAVECARGARRTAAAGGRDVAQPVEPPRFRPEGRQARLVLGALRSTSVRVAAQDRRPWRARSGPPGGVLRESPEELMPAQVRADCRLAAHQDGRFGVGRLDLAQTASGGALVARQEMQQRGL